MTFTAGQTILVAGKVRNADVGLIAAAMMQVQSTNIRAPALFGMMPRPAWGNDCINPRSCGLMFAIDGRERWLVHNFMAPSADLSSVDRDRSLREVLGVGPLFTFEILGQEDWTGRRMIADRFRDRRVFLCGDAAHIWVPFAGYGMNAGIADAMDLSWTLAGVIKGWADPALLDAYEIERQPITEQASRCATNTSLARTALQSAVPGTIEDAGPEGDAVRARIDQQVYDIDVDQFCCGGLNFGYFYTNSAVVAYDGKAAPSYHPRFQPINGAWLPHTASVAAQWEVALRRGRIRFRAVAFRSPRRDRGSRCGGG